MPKVSIALITYNRPQFLRYAIQGVLAQSFSDFELIIMDNGSEVNTWNVVKGFTDHRIRYHRNLENSRDYMNLAFLLAKGKYLLITHDDDIMMENMIEQEIEYFENDEDVIAVSCNMRNISESGNMLDIAHKFKRDVVFNKKEFIEFYVKTGISLTCPTVLLHLERMNQHNLKFDVSVGPAMDVFLWISANLFPYKIYFICKPLYYYRIHPSQDSTLSKLEMEISLFKHLEELFVKNNINNYLKPLKRLKTNQITSIITHNYINNQCSKYEFLKLVNSLKEIGLDYHDYWKSDLIVSTLILFPSIFKRIFNYYLKIKSKQLS
jgi:glycosyltransferase involved in cell wall biosynthesis